MKWKEEFSVGIPEIDEEHQVLVQCVTDIEAKVTSGEGSSVVHSAIGRFVSILGNHFSGEERLMRHLNYPDFAAHIVEHEQFMADVKAIEARTLSDPLPPELVAILRKWLEDHFMSDDKHYAAFFRQHRAEGDKPVNEQ